MISKKWLINFKFHRVNLKQLKVDITGTATVDRKSLIYYCCRGQYAEVARHK